MSVQSVMRMKSWKRALWQKPQGDLYFVQRMTRMWANYGVQMPMGRWYLLCFLAFCFSGKSRVRSHCRKLKPDTLDMRWIFLMLTVINSWNNRHGNLTDPPRLGLLIKARRTWKKKKAKALLCCSPSVFSIISGGGDFSAGSVVTEAKHSLFLFAGCRGFQWDQLYLSGPSGISGYKMHFISSMLGQAASWRAEQEIRAPSSALNI